MTGNLDGDCSYNVGVWVLMLFAVFRTEDAHALLVATCFLLYTVLLVRRRRGALGVTLAGHCLAWRLRQGRHQQRAASQQHVHADGQVLPRHGDAGALHQGACVLVHRQSRPTAVGGVCGASGVQAPRRRSARALSVTAN